MSRVALANGEIPAIWIGQVSGGASVFIRHLRPPVPGVPLAPSISYVHTDHLGTPQILTNESQDIVWAGEYEPFGTVNITTSTVTNNLRFPGQYFDAETGLSYNYFRDYAPELGRYFQSDPIGLAVGDFIGQNVGKIVGIDEGKLDIEEIVQDEAGNWTKRHVSLDKRYFE